MMTKFRSC